MSKHTIGGSNQSISKSKAASREIRAAYQSVNPYDGKTLKTFKELTDQQLEKALKTAAACFETWRRTTFAERAVVAAKAAAIMRARVAEFARPVTLEMGKRFEEAHGEVALSADIIDYYAKNAERFLAPQKLKPGSGEAVVENSPFGVLFGVQPWNFPYYQLARFAAPNLMAGNVVMVKHAGVFRNAPSASRTCGGRRVRRQAPTPIC